MIFSRVIGSVSIIAYSLSLRETDNTYRAFNAEQHQLCIECPFQNSP